MSYGLEQETTRVGDVGPPTSPARARSAADAAVTIDDLTIHYPGRKRGDVLAAVEHLSMTVDRGELVAIVGPSGCGKSTLMKAIAGLLDPVAGDIRLASRAGSGDRTAVATVFQSPRLLPWSTVLKNAAYGLESHRIPRKEAKRIAQEELRRVGLESYEGAYPRQLSGGMQQRVNVARALALKPTVLLLDEPLSSLDAQTREIMQQELVAVLSDDIGADGRGTRTALLVTHQVDEALFMADRVVVLTGRPARVKLEIQVPFERPRKLSLKRSPQFHELEDLIWENLEGLGQVDD